MIIMYQQSLWTLKTNMKTINIICKCGKEFIFIDKPRLSIPTKCPDCVKLKHKISAHKLYLKNKRKRLKNE